MEKVKMSELNRHAALYIREIMEGKMRLHGFVCRPNDPLHWYRLIDNVVIQAVYFTTAWTRLPLILDISYSHAPLFIPPEYSKNVHMVSGLRSIEAVGNGRPIMKDRNRFVYREDIAVTCPDDEYGGADLLDPVFIQLERANTSEDCYRIHKEHYLAAAKQLKRPVDQILSNASIDFFNEAIMNGDLEMETYALASAEKYLRNKEYARSVRKLVKRELEQIQDYQRLKDALEKGQKAEYIFYLQSCAEENLKKLKKVLSSCE